MKRLTVALMMLAFAAQLNAVSLYVSPDGSDANPGTKKQPLKTLSAAQLKVRSLRNFAMPKDGMTVYLRGGRYQLDKTLVFGPKDSGLQGRPIIWQAYKDEKPVISGGVPITGWTEYKNGIWKAQFKSNKKLRQLYVNGVPADMAFYGKKIIPKGWRMKFKITGKESWAAEPGNAYEGIAFAAKDLPKIAHPEDLELQQIRTWTIQRVNVAAIKDGENGEKIVVLERPFAAIGQRMAWGCEISMRRKKECYLYNALEFVDKPGEFYFDKSSDTVYYKPRKGDNMATAKAIAPKLVKLVDLRGPNRKTHVHDIQFKGITFSHTGWQMMEADGMHGGITCQSSAMTVKFLHDGMWHSNPAAPIYTSTDIPPGAVELNGADRIGVYRSTFRCLAAQALNIENDVSYVDVVGNIFYLVDGPGVNIGHPHHTYIGKQNGDNYGFGPYNIDNSKDKWDESVEGLVKHVNLSNNLFRNVCLTWWQMSPITLYYGHSIYIEHNDVLGTPYNAITIGWGWAEFDGIPAKRKHHNELGKIGGKPSFSTDGIKVNWNRVWHPYTKLHDTGAIYFLGDCALQMKEPAKQKYSQVIGNYLMEGKPSGAAGLFYTDEGSAYLEFHENVIDGNSGLRRITSRGVDSRNKIFTNNYVAEYSIFKPKRMDLNSLFKDNFQMIRKRNNKPLPIEKWPEGAQKVIKKAGLTDEYKYLLKEIN
jgi:hypothetical protein